MEKTNLIYEILEKKEVQFYLGFLAVLIYLTKDKYR